jgi:hypothetical protein
MKQHPTQHRRVAALLFAAAALPFTPGLAQETTAPPPVVVTPPPVVIAPPPPVTTAPTVAPIVLPPVTRAAAPPAPEARPTTRTATRAPARQATPARRAPAVAAAPAPPPVAEAVPPAAEPVPTATTPTETATIPPVISEETPVPVETGEPQGATPWALIAAIVGLIAAGAALFLLLRNRRRRVEEDEVYYDAPVVAAPVTPTIEPQPYIAPYVAPAMVRDEPVIADEPVFAADSPIADPTPAVETLSVGEPASGDVAAMAAASQPSANRPWLEMLMRPLRAGTTSVEFELTVGNTGSVSAKDVKISTWMFPAGGQSSEMERLLIDSEASIEPGDGTRVQAAIAMNKAQFDESVLPVVVADARYTLPDGSEGRTEAAFAFGLAQDGELVPFPTDRSSGLLETVEARLHGDLKRN